MVVNSENFAIKDIYFNAFVSRLWFLFLSFVSNLIIVDHVSDSFISPVWTDSNFSLVDKIVWILFGGLVRWDAQHFLHISSYGYTYENNLPFFPLFPILTKALALSLHYIFGLNSPASLLLAAVTLNTLFFIEAAATLCELTKIIFGSEKFTFYTVLFFCISPATIFFLAPYSESLFSMCTFKGMLRFTKREYLYSFLWFAISVLVRSNGLVNIGFILHLFYFYITQTKFRNFKFILKYAFYIVLNLIGVFLPFVAFQLSLYKKFCFPDVDHSETIVQYALLKNLTLAGQGSAWCNNTIPFSYSYIQQHYWNVGFLRYYSVKQIPNFLLASPLVAIIIRFCGEYLYQNKDLLLNPQPIYNGGKFRPFISLPRTAFIFVVHVVYLTLFCVLNINVQVTTRLIASSSPLIYWLGSQQLISNKSEPSKQFQSRPPFFNWISDFRKDSEYVIKGYFMTYAVLGTVLFTNNYPWT